MIGLKRKCFLSPPSPHQTGISLILPGGGGGEEIESWSLKAAGSQPGSWAPCCGRENTAEKWMQDSFQQQMRPEIGLQRYNWAGQKDKRMANCPPRGCMERDL